MMPFFTVLVMFNGDTIKISVDHDVLDGQHRLWAIIEAKIAVPTLIIYGIKREAFTTIDTIRKLRSAGDTVALGGQTRYRNYIASALQWLLRHKHRCIPIYRAAQHKIENYEILEALEEHPNIVRAVERTAHLRGLTNPPIMA